MAACTPAAETQTHRFQKYGHLLGRRIVGWQFAVQKPIHLPGVVAVVVGNITRRISQALQLRADVPKIRRDQVQNGLAGNLSFALRKALLEPLPGDSLDLQRRAANEDHLLARLLGEGCWGATEHKTGLRQALDPKVLNQLPF